MLHITQKRRRNLFLQILSELDSSVVLFDIGSGGDLKEPWSLIPEDTIEIIGVDPEEVSSSGNPICISSKSGQSTFHIAQNPRASSLHKTEEKFISRFGMTNLRGEKEITVDCVSTDEYLGNRVKEVDVLDINTEGHDYYVLNGAERLFNEGLVKLVKVEFELSSIWEQQKYFSDIDKLMRQRGYELTDLEIESSRPIAFPRGRAEPIWGKAWYAPSVDYWVAAMNRMNNVDFESQRNKAVAVYIICDMPARALELIDLKCGGQPDNRMEDLREKLSYAYRFDRFECGGRQLFAPIQKLLRYIKYDLCIITR